MVRAFRQSRLTVMGVFAVSVVLAGLVWVRDREMPVLIPLIACALLLLLGVFLGRLAGNLVADSCNTKLLGLLHVELNPEAFLAGYIQVPGRLKPDSRDYVVACAYLADGYAAKGDFDGAIAALCPPEQAGLGESAALRGLYLQNLCGYRLGKGDREAGALALAELEKVAAGCAGTQDKLAQNLTETAAVLRSRLACLAGRPVDRPFLEKQARQAPYKLRRLDAIQLLALDALRRQRRREAVSLLEELRDGGGKTWYAAWAAEQLRTCAGE